MKYPEVSKLLENGILDAISIIEDEDLSSLDVIEENMAKVGDRKQALVIINNFAKIKAQFIGKIDRIKNDLANVDNIAHKQLLVRGGKYKRSVDIAKRARELYCDNRGQPPKAGTPERVDLDRATAKKEYLLGLGKDVVRISLEGELDAAKQLLEEARTRTSSKITTQMRELLSVDNQLSAVISEGATKNG